MPPEQQIPFKRRPVVQPFQNRPAQNIRPCPGVRAGQQTDSASGGVFKRLRVPLVPDFVAEDRLRRHRAQKHLHGRRLIDAAHHVYPFFRLARREKLLPLVADRHANPHGRQLFRRVAQHRRLAASRRAEKQRTIDPPAFAHDIRQNAAARPRNVSGYANTHGGRRRKPPAFARRHAPAHARAAAVPQRYISLRQLGFIGVSRMAAERRHQLVHIPLRKKDVLRFAAPVKHKAGVLPGIKAHFLQPPHLPERHIQQELRRLGRHPRRQRPPLILQRLTPLERKKRRGFVPLRSSYVGYTGFSPLQ